MSATKRQMNWSGVGFTPQSGTLTTYTGVTAVEYAPNVSVAGFSGDGDKYTTTKVVDMQDPKFTLTCADVAAVMANAIGARGTFTATNNDAKNGAGAGAITYTMVNALLSDRPSSGNHRQFTTASCTFESESSDGQTNPVSVSIS